MLRNEMWKIFKCTGNINAYLYYKDSEKYNIDIKSDVEIDVLKEDEKILQGF